MIRGHTGDSLTDHVKMQHLPSTSAWRPRPRVRILHFHTCSARTARFGLLARNILITDRMYNRVIDSEPEVLVKLKSYEFEKIKKFVLNKWNICKTFLIAKLPLPKNISICNYLLKKGYANRDSHIAFLQILQSRFFEELRCLILASSQRKLYGYIEFLKFDVRIKRIKKFKFV